MVTNPLEQRMLVVRSGPLGGLDLVGLTPLLIEKVEAVDGVLLKVYSVENCRKIGAVGAVESG